jgi:glycine betaine/proline transport system ATP-binding protein
VFITHDLAEAMKVGDRIAIMKDGVVEQIGTAEEILTNPATDYVEAFVEKVDRKTIITAETLMFKHPTTIKLKKDGPKGVIRKMRETGLNVLPVVAEDEKFLGHVWLEDMLKLEQDKFKTVESKVYSEVPSVYKHYTVEEMLPLITGHYYPLAVINEDDGKLLGLVTQTSLIIESTRFTNKEMDKLMDTAKEL